MSKINAEDFSIKKKHKDFKKAVIERGNLTSTFTIAELESDQISLERSERETTGQIRVSNAAIDNIDRNHSFVSKLSDEQLRTAAYLYETKQVLEAAEKRLKEIKDAKKKYREVLSTVYNKFGFVESNVMDNEPSTEPAE